MLTGACKAYHVLARWLSAGVGAADVGERLK